MLCCARQITVSFQFAQRKQQMSNKPKKTFRNGEIPTLEGFRGRLQTKKERGARHSAHSLSGPFKALLMDEV
jgi:hypothetical protein